MTHCPSCGRYIGPHEACHYCGARLAGRTSIRAVKIAAVALATVGLAILWFAAIRAEVDGLDVERFALTVSGTSRIDASGRAGSVRLRMSGAANVDT